MERNGKTNRRLWNKNNIHRCFSIFSVNMPNYFLPNGTEWNGTKKLIYIFGIKTMFMGVSQFLAQSA
jgi:hypothetical protein